MYTVLHMFRQVLFWAENQSKHQNFKKSLLLLAELENELFLVGHFDYFISFYFDFFDIYAKQCI